MIQCQICKDYFGSVSLHIRSHKVTIAEYRNMFPGVVTHIEPDAVRALRSTTKGRKQTAEHIEKRVKAVTGFKHTEQSRQKISKAHQGKTLSQDHKKKLSAALRGREFGSEHRENLKAGWQKSPNRFTPESSKRLSAALKGRKVLHETLVKRTATIEKRKILKMEDRKNILAQYDVVLTASHNKFCDMLCLKCTNAFRVRESVFYPASSEQALEFLCPECYPKNTSTPEREVASWLRDITQIEQSNTKILKGKEIDIVIPKNKLGIEFNGSFWHSHLRKPPTYHQEKSLLAREQGYHLVHIFEHEWATKREIIKSLLLSQIGLTERIFARQCTVAEVPFKSVRDFLNKNHLQGSGNGGKSFALFYQNDIIAIMTFGKPRYDKRFDWEMIRFCTRLGYSVIGGMGKLLNAFKKKYNPDSILSYVDFSKFSGRGYEAVGFIQEEITKPGYFYLDGFNNEISRYEAQPKKLNQIAGTTGRSESEFRDEYKWLQIYNSGNLKMIWRKST